MTNSQPPAKLLSVQPVLMAHDVATSVRFYERLGFRVTFQDQPTAPRYAAVVRDGVELHLQWNDTAALGERPTYRFLVDDVDALFAQWLASGSIPDEPHRSPWARPADTPWGTREFHLHDPAGNGLQFYRAR